MKNLDDGARLFIGGHEMKPFDGTPVMLTGTDAERKRFSKFWAEFNQQYSGREAMSIAPGMHRIGGLALYETDIDDQKCSTHLPLIEE